MALFFQLVSSSLSASIIVTKALFIAHHCAIAWQSRRRSFFVFNGRARVVPFVPQRIKTENSRFHVNPTNVTGKRNKWGVTRRSAVPFFGWCVWCVRPWVTMEGKTVKSISTTKQYDNTTMTLDNILCFTMMETIRRLSGGKRWTRYFKPKLTFSCPHLRWRAFSYDTCASYFYNDRKKSRMANRTL